MFPVGGDSIGLDFHLYNFQDVLTCTRTYMKIINRAWLVFSKWLHWWKTYLISHCLIEVVFTKNSQTQYPIFLWLHHSIRSDGNILYLSCIILHTSRKISQTFLVPFANLKNFNKILNKALLLWTMFGYTAWGLEPMTLGERAGLPWAGLQFITGLIIFIIYYDIETNSSLHQPCRPAKNRTQELFLLWGNNA